MPYSNEHAARLRNPDDFEKDSFRRKNIEDGIDIIIGKLKGEDTMTTQAYRFDSQKYTASEAKNWLEKHNVEYISFEPAENSEIIENHIFVYGEIIPFQGSSNFEYGVVSLKDVINQINENKSANKLIVHIHSPGGDVNEGFAIHDALVSSGKEVITIIEGLCASIATVVALAGERRLMTENSEFMIHNPWAFGIGDSEDLKKQSEHLAKTENKLAEFYSKRTNLKVEQLLDYMHNETFFSAKEAQDFGFVTEIIQTMRQVAHFKNYKYMENEKFEKHLSIIESTIQKIMNFLNPVKNLVIQDVNGVEIDFGSDIKSQDEIKPGVKATINSSPASGEYVISTGETLVFENGELKEIKPKEVVEQKQESEEETQEMKALRNQLNVMLNGLNKLKYEFDLMKNEYSSTQIPIDVPVTDSKKRKAFKNLN